jgi:hypothetical protein
MKFAATLASTLALLGSALAAPAPAPELDARGGGHHPAQTVHLTFHAGPVSYSLAIPADGSFNPTNQNSLNVNLIDTPDFNAIEQCTFQTSGPKTLVNTFNPETGVQSIAVGPPQVITGVSCNGYCIPVYGDCYANGQFLGPCCNGICAANKCRPY